MIIYILCSLPIINGNLSAQSSIVKDFRLIPNPITVNDTIKFIIEYNYVPGTTEPWTTDTLINDTVFIVSHINSVIGSSFKQYDYKDTITIGKLSEGNYVLSHRLWDWGKIYFLGTDTIFSFTVLSSTNKTEIIHDMALVSMYPNPNSGIIHLDFNENFLGVCYTFEIISSEGIIIEQRHLIAKFSDSINLNSIESGVYLIRITAEGIVQITWMILM